MERAELESLISRMEQLARDEPGAYRRRVFWLAALGYAYMLFVVLALLALTVGAVMSVTTLGILGGKLAAVAGVLLIAVVCALRVRLQPRLGERVTRADAPELFRLLGALQVRLKTAPIHEVVITPNLNAAVTQVPRLGLFGWHRNFVLLGLPLMKGLTIEQLKSVLAHEVGQLARGHARAGNWIYRMRMIWARLEAIFELNPQWGSGFIRAFFRWYIPYFNAVSFPFARQNEYEADAASVLVTSARGTAQALTGVHLVGSYLQLKYWPAAHAALQDSARPAIAPFGAFNAHAIREVPQAELKQWFATAIGQRTSHEDTHPSLADRLKAIVVRAEFAPPGPGEGAEKLLGASLARIEGKFDRLWREQFAKRAPTPVFATAPRR
jgi:Zn-dependent protease with chaperone function